MRRIVTTAAVAVAMAAGGAATAQAQAPDPLGGVLGTGSQCGTGLVELNVGGSPVCALTGTTVAPTGEPCPPGLTSVSVAGRGLLCLAPGDLTGGGSGGATPCPTTLVAVQLPGGQGVACVLASDVQAVPAGGCPAGTSLVQVLGSDALCVLTNLLGTGATGGDGGGGGTGTPGTPGAPGGAGGAGGAGGTGSGGGGGTSGTGSGAGSRPASSPSTTRASRLVKPRLAKRQRAKRRVVRGQIRSSTRKVTVRVTGRRGGKVVKQRKTFTLRDTDKGARPFRKTVKLKVKTAKRVKVRVISKQGGQKKAAVFKVKPKRRR